MANTFTNPPAAPASYPLRFAIAALRIVAACIFSMTAVSASANLTFEPNHGQMPANVRFTTRGEGYRLYFTADHIALALNAETGPAVMRLSFVGAARTPKIEGLELLASRSHYIKGSDPSKWVTNVPHYRRVVYRDAYPNIDAVYYGTDGELEYDFTIRPGGDPARIRFRTDAEIRLEATGELLMRSGGEEIRWRRPVAYQQINGQRRPVDVTYDVAAQTIRFAVPAYDPRYTLVIDPVLKYSTYHGGGTNDVAYDVAVDKEGFRYLVGQTEGGFPLTAAAQTAYGGNRDGVVSKYSRDGSALIYSTYLGGSSWDDVRAIDTDVTGAAYVIGDTQSANFPTTVGAYRTARPVNTSNAFVTKLAPQGTPVYSTYIGPYAHRQPDICVDNAGYAYITTEGSPEYPATPPIPSSAVSSSNDIVVTKINQTGTGLTYSLRINAHQTNPNPPLYVYNDRGMAIRVDKEGYAYVAGTTTSDNLPGVAGGYQSSPGGAWTGGSFNFEINHDAFVFKINQAGTGTVAGTYFGGNSDDDAFGLALDDEGNVYVGGLTGSSNLTTTANAFRTSGTGFVVKFNNSLSIASYMTYFPDGVRKLDVHEGYVYVVGGTRSATFPVVDAHQAALAGSGDGYLSVLNRKGTALTYSTYFGGTDYDGIRGLYVDADANAYFSGETQSTNFPTLNPRQGALGGESDAFLAVISFDKDGDGLLDRWEELGIDINEDGTVDLDLPGLGANKNHKDLFLEIDYMQDNIHTHHPDRTPSNQTLSGTAPTAALIAAFASAPVTNPDGNNGIALHVLVDEALAHQTPITLTGANSDFNRIKLGAPASPCGTAHFARAADRASTNCQQIVAARRRVYRYAIFGHDQAHVLGSSGMAELPGNDLLVSLSSGVRATTNDFDDLARQRSLSFGTTFDAEWADTVAGTLMHELGHTLGLHHGGGIGIADLVSREIPHKPNYLSVMNYAFQFNHAARDAANPAVLTRTNRSLNYSSGVLPILNEAALNENAGVQGPAGARTIFRQGSTGYSVRIAPAQGPIDWNGQNGLEASVAVDINTLQATAPASPGEILEGHDDWSNLIYNFRAMPDYDDGAGFENVGQTPELTSEEVEEIGTNPPSCALTAPLDGQFISGPADITLQANAIAGEAPVSRVEFYDGSTKLGEDVSSPYSFVWSNVPLGSYELSARAIDDLGLVGTSESVAVTVTCGPIITQLSASQTIYFGSSISLSVDATGDGIGYQWYRGTVGSTADPVVGGTGATVNMTPGGTTLYWVRVTNSCDSTDSSQITISVIPSAVGALNATRTGAVVALQWGAAGGSAYYEIERQDSGVPFRVVATLPASATSFNDDGCPHTCVYRVRALDESSTYASSFSNHDPATTGMTPVIAGQRIAAVTLGQLLQSVNGLRSAAGASALAWSDILPAGTPTPAAGGRMYAVHLQAIRTAINTALQANGIVPRAYTNQSVAPGDRIRAIDIRETQQQIE